ncbi:hypothetical protein Tco_0836646 [Tanacetum coccineum]
MAILSQRIDDLTKGKNEKWSEKGKGEKGLIAESFDWNDESVSLEDEDTTKIKAFMAIVEDEPSVRKADARSCQWVEITIKKNVYLFNGTTSPFNQPGQFGPWLWEVCHPRQGLIVEFLSRAIWVSSHVRKGNRVSLPSGLDPTCEVFSSISVFNVIPTSLCLLRNLADWLGVEDIGLFNFKPSVRPLPFEVHIQASQNVDENLPQLLDERGGSHVPDVPAFDKDDFTSWKVRAPADVREYVERIDVQRPAKHASNVSDIMVISRAQYLNDVCIRKRALAAAKQRDSIRVWEVGPGNHQKDYNGKYKGLKAEMAILSQRIDDLTQGKNEKERSEKGKSKKGLIAESFDWNDESVSSDDEDTTKIKAFMAIAKDEPSVRKADEITMKKEHIDFCL